MTFWGIIGNIFSRVKKSLTFAGWDSYVSAENLYEGNLYFIASIGSKSILRIITRKKLSNDEEYQFFNYLKKYSTYFESETGIKPNFKLRENHDFQLIQFQRKSEWFGYLSLPENSKSKDEVFKWLKENTLKIENIIQKAYEEFKEKEYSEQEVTE